MDKPKKFQEQLKSQILKIGIITLIILLSLFYIGTYLFNLNYDTNRLDDSNDYLHNKVVNLFNVVDKTNKELLNVNDAEDVTVYNYLYKVNSELGIRSNILIFNDEKENIFNSNNATTHGSYNQYVNILLKNLDNDLDNYISIKPTGYENQLLIGKKGDKGYSVIIISESDLIKYLDKSSSYAVIDKKNHVVVSNNYRFINNIYKFTPSTSNLIKIDDVTYVYSTKVLDNNLTLISFVIKQNIIDMKFITISMLFIGILLTLLINNFSKRLSKNTSKSLDLLMDQIEQIKQDKSRQIGNINTNDEFETLSIEINKMLDNIAGLNNKNTELLKLNKQIEIKQLESQFNPHFLYNTLETIRYVMYMDANLASDLILKLTNILRYSISFEKDFAILKEDIKYIENYLEICKVRFQERFNYTLKIDKKCENLLIPKLIFQPIIENSIKHNFKNKSSLSIWVTSEIIDNRLHIEIEDNGDGMNEEELENIKKIFELESNNSTHIGLYNVYKRLKLKYDNDFMFNIYSRSGVGTKIAITIPLEVSSV